MEFVIPRHWANRTWRVPGRLSVFGTYQDFPSGARFYEFCRRLSDLLGPTYKVKRQAVPFSALSSRLLRAEYAREATSGDMVIVSARNGICVPPELLEWSDCWDLKSGNTPSVLCAILKEHESPLANPLVLFLEDFARSLKLEFLLHVQ